MGPVKYIPPQREYGPDCHSAGFLFLIWHASTPKNGWGQILSLLVSIWTLLKILFLQNIVIYQLVLINVEQPHLYK